MSGQTELQTYKNASCSIFISVELNLVGFGAVLTSLDYSRVAAVKAGRSERMKKNILTP